MKSNFRILCPIDFSECSLNALEFATRLGEFYKGDLVLYHVLNKEDYKKLSPNDTQGVNQERFVREKLSNLREAVDEEGLRNGLVSCKIQLDEGDIEKRIQAFVAEQKVDLIVVGTEGVNGRRNRTMGSKASSLVGNSEIDVLVIPRAAYFKPFRKIAYAQDYLEEDKLAIQKVVALAEFFDTNLDIVHFESNINDRTKSLHLTMEEELTPFVNYPKTHFSLSPYKGDLKEGVEQFLESQKINLLFTLSEKQSIMDRLLDRSLSKKLAASINKPLWVIKSF